MTDGPFLPAWESLAAYRVPDWFRDAKFGIFIHWGPYSVPAFGNEWYSRNMHQPGKPEFEHHRRTYGPQSEFGYKDFIPLLTGASTASSCSATRRSSSRCRWSSSGVRMR
jgi:alpha-L-fucosidase